MMPQPTTLQQRWSTAPGRETVRRVGLAGSSSENHDSVALASPSFSCNGDALQLGTNRSGKIKILRSE